MTYVLDACALIALLNDEPGADEVAGLIKRAEAGEISLYMNGVQALEVYYDRIKVKDRAFADVFLESLYTSSITIADSISPEIIREAGRLKTSYKCSLADTFGLATAVSLGATFVTSDHHELETVAQNELISFLWLPPKPKK
jgi:predicted nucleic acid-binding protein